MRRFLDISSRRTAGAYNRCVLEALATARLWRVASVSAMVGLLACSRQVATPVAPRHSGAAGAEHGSWATTGDSIPDAFRDPCAQVNRLVRSVVGAAPSSTRITSVNGPRAITFTYQFAKAQSAGCEFVARGSDTRSSSSLFEAMETAFHDAKWMSMEATYSGDGPDGSDLGYSRNGVLCVIEGRWDGGDDIDRTVIPGPDFDVFVTCAPLRADDQPS